MRQKVLLLHATRTVVDSIASPYVCGQCLAQARSRALHSSAPRLAEREPLWKRTWRRLVGSKEDDEAVMRQEAAREERVAKIRSGKEVEVETMQVDGVKYNVAPVFRARTTVGYEPATSGGSLQTIATEKWVKQQADQGEEYQSLIPRTRVKLSDAQWQYLLRIALTRILILLKDGRPLDEVRKWQDSDLRTGLTGVLLQVTGNKVELVFQSPEVERSSMSPTTGDQAREQESAASPSAALAKLCRWDPEPASKATKSPAWMRVPLTDSKIKLALAKHVVKLTGHRIPDLAISKATVAEHIYRALTVKPTPAKISQTEQVKALKFDSPNVTVYTRRRTAIHKDKDVGRWKIIEQELSLRGLPLPGSVENQQRHRNMKIIATTDPRVKKPKTESLRRKSKSNA